MLRALLICLFLLTNVVPGRETGGLMAAVYLNDHHDRPHHSRPQRKNAKIFIHHQRLKRWTRKMLLWLAYISLAWTVLYLLVRSKDEDGVSEAFAYILAGLMIIAGGIIIWLFFAWVWWLVRAFWRWLFPARLQKNLRKCYQW